MRDTASDAVRSLAAPLQGLTAREALNGAVLAAMVASYFVIVFLFSA